jgi:hypothetical protein
MKTLIVSESMFGNTERVARGIADGCIAAGGHATTADVNDLRSRDLAGCDLLVVGAPTHAFSLSRRSTREDAVRQGASPTHAAVGLREWLATLIEESSATASRPAVAVFDTRVRRVRRLPGSAAKRAASVLRAGGFDILDRPTSFFVDDVSGPLVRGELERAHAWGRRLSTLTRDTSGRPGTTR